MSELITEQIFTDGQQNINAADMNGIIGKAAVQPDIIANKPASATLDVSDQFLVLKTDNTLARGRFDTFVNSTSSSLPLADSTKNGMLRQVSGVATDFVGGDNYCHPLWTILPPGMVVDFAGPNIPSGWLVCNGQSVLRATYPNLYGALGAAYGAVDGNHFNLPNFNGRFAIGSDDNFYPLSAPGGAAWVSLAVGHLPSHAHSITDVTHSHGASASSSDSGHTHSINPTFISGGSGVTSGGGWLLGTSNTGTGYANISTSVSVAASGTGLSTTQAVGSGTAFSILPPYLCVYKIIKY